MKFFVTAAGRQSEVLCRKKKSESHIEERLKIFVTNFGCHILFLGFSDACIDLYIAAEIRLRAN